MGLAVQRTGLSFPEMVRVLRGAAESRSIRVSPCRNPCSLSSMTTGAMSADLFEPAKFPKCRIQAARTASPGNPASPCSCTSPPNIAERVHELSKNCKI